MNHHRFIVALGASAALVPLTSTVCRAQTQSSTLEEVVVTAQKRDTTVLDTPATVDVVSEETLRNFRVNDLQGLNRLVPGFQFDMGAGSNMTLSIRGVGTTSSAQSFEQSVAPYIDGVYLGGNNRDFSWPLFDIQQIEVLKGTQSGIAGQNTSVGVVNIVTNKPGRTVGGYFMAGGEFLNDGYNAEGAIDVPFSDTVQARFSGYYNQRGGWIHNAATGHDVGENTTYAGRINLAWAASDSVDVRLFGEYDHMKQIGSATAIIYRDPTGGYTRYISPYIQWRPEQDVTAYRGTNPIPSIGVEYGGDSGVLADTAKGSLMVDVELGGGFRLTSVTAASTIDDKLSVDQDFTAADTPTAADPTQSQWLAQNSSYEQYTEELRLTSPESERLNYMIGLWYRHAVQEKTTNIYISPLFPAPRNGISWPFKQTTDNASIFGDVNFKLTDRFTIGGTARYTKEEKEGQVEGNSVFNANPTFPAFPLFTTDLDDDFVDGSVRLQFEPNSTSTYYALYSHGTKTGALVDLVASGQPQVVKPEVVETIEIGAKFDLLDRALMLNVSLFDFDIKDYQDSFTAALGAGGAVIFVASNSDVTGYGSDVQIQWHPTDSLRIGFSGEYLDADNKTFGGRFVRTPKWHLAGNVDFSFQLFGLESSVFASVVNKTEYYNYPYGQAARVVAKTPGYTTADAGLDVSPSEHLTLQLLCRNCTNEYPKIRATSGTFGPTRAPGVYGYIPELRTVAVMATYRF